MSSHQPLRAEPPDIKLNDRTPNISIRLSLPSTPGGVRDSEWTPVHGHPPSHMSLHRGALGKVNAACIGTLGGSTWATVRGTSSPVTAALFLTLTCDSSTRMPLTLCLGNTGAAKRGQAESRSRGPEHSSPLYSRYGNGSRQTKHRSCPDRRRYGINLSWTNTVTIVPPSARRPESVSHDEWPLLFWRTCAHRRERGSSTSRAVFTLSYGRKGTISLARGWGPAAGTTDHTTRGLRNLSGLEVNGPRPLSTGPACAGGAASRVF